MLTYKKINKSNLKWSTEPGWRTGKQELIKSFILIIINLFINLLTN